MSALGKLDFLGDFDEQGQLVEVPKRPTLAERKSLAERKAAVARKPAPQGISRSPQTTAQDLTRLAVKPPMPAPLAKKPVPADLKLDRSRDALLTAFGKATLNDRYLMPGESFQDMFARVSCAYADDIAHAQRL